MKVLHEELDKRFKAIDERLQLVEEKLNDIEQQSTQEQTKDLSAEVIRLTKELEYARQDARDAVCAANDAEQYNRRNNVRIKGLRVQQGEDCRRNVVEFIPTSLNVDINEDDIEGAHPLPVRG